MSVQISVTGQLKTLFGDRADVMVEAGSSARETLKCLAVKPELVAGVVVNGGLQTKDYVLQDGDQVRLFAVMGGG